METTEPPSDIQLPPYYTDLNNDEISTSFKNFDVGTNFDLFDQQLRSPHSSNFVLDFSDEDAHAWCAFDLSSSSVSQLLASPRPAGLHTRWINMWMPYNQKDTLHALARHYDFSPRLLGLMCSDPIVPVPRQEGTENGVRERQSSGTLRSRRSGRSQGSRKSKRSQRSRMEKGAQDESEESIGMSALMHSTQLEMVRDLSHYRIVDDVWHWSSVDWGRRFVCIGYNTLHNVRTKTTFDHDSDSDHNDETTRSRDVPLGKRIWNWLLLCEDKTVISISEDPFPFHNGKLLPLDLKTLYTVRRNLVSVFRQLTKAPTPLRDMSLVMLPIRHRVGNSDEETAHRATDVPGLLFYYLFEDWYTTYHLVTRREQGYAAELDRLRREMLHKANLTHVDQLHHIGCQLSLLKRVYQSYELIIERILKKQEATLASLKNSRIVSGADSLSSSLPHMANSHDAGAGGGGGMGGMGGGMALGLVMPEADSLLGVSLSSAARVRFERLKDRICLYALSEIQECIDQKESLVMMNFNLIAIKESFSVERLTRITLLLAEITILFTPVTLMTGYFSIQFAGVEFSVTEYWLAFLVTVLMSFVFVFLFSFFSGTMDGKLIARPWSRMMYDISKRWLMHKRRMGIRSA